MSIAMPLWLLLMTSLFIVLPIVIGIFVYKDASSRGMNASLWTLIAVLIPAAIGLIIYLVVRSDFDSYECPNCKGLVKEEFSSCPKCGTQLKSKCMKCGYALNPDWDNCPSCGEPVPADKKMPALTKRRDTGIGKILIAVILIPILIMAMLFIGFVNFRAGDSSSLGSVDGMRIEDFVGNKAVSDWLKYCNQAGDGIYVLEYQYPQDTTNKTNRSNFIVYRSGLTKDVSVSASFGGKGFFDKTWKVEYLDAATESPVGYHIYQVDCSSTGNIVLEVYVNGKKADYKLTKSNEPLGFADPISWRNDAANLYKLRLDYLGDASGVIRLVRETGLEFAGEYTLELKTSERPYGLKVIYSNTTDKFEIIDFTQNSTELLGLIKNLDYVEITNGVTIHKLTAEEASQALGYDVKEFGTNPTKLEQYLKSIYESYVND